MVLSLCKLNVLQDIFLSFKRGKNLSHCVSKAFEYSMLENCSQAIFFSVIFVKKWLVEINHCNRVDLDCLRVTR